MLVLDASSIVKAWDEYPPSIFPKLWTWLGDEVRNKRLRLTEPNLVEVGHVSPDCHAWLKKHGHDKVLVTPRMLGIAVQIKAALGIQNELYSNKGVDEGDILAISAAKDLGTTLISDEERQPSLPAVIKNCKIPATCLLPSVGVRCIGILDHIKASGKKFG